MVSLFSVGGTRFWRIGREQNGKLVGSATEKIEAIMARTGTAYTLEPLPWKRAYTLARERPDGCVDSTRRTPEREALFKRVGPTDEAEWLLFGRADRVYHVQTLDDARGLRIGTYNGDARDAYLRSRGFLVEAVQGDASNPRKLLMGRIDLWAVSVGAGKAALIRDGWAGRIVPVLSFRRLGVYLACNLAVPDELIARLNAALDALRKDGTAQRLERKYDKDAAQAPPLMPDRP